MSYTHFITGSGGFIGKAIYKYLQAEGYRPINIPRGGLSHMYYFVGAEKTITINCQSYGNQYHQKDVEMHIVANCTELLNYVNNFVGLKFYNFSTSSVHLKQQTLYSATKLVGEKIIESLNDPRFVNVRPYSIFGKGEAPHRFIPTVIRCLQSGESMPLVTGSAHDWTHIDDMIPAMFAGHTELGTGESYTNLQIVDMLQDISGKKLNFEKVESLRSYDTDDWRCPEPIPHQTIYDRLKQTYYDITGKDYVYFA